MIRATVCGSGNMAKAIAELLSIVGGDRIT